MELSTVLWFALGWVLLIGGAELLVRGASGLAAALGLSPLVIGLTVVAFGTSAPELAVSVQSSLAGQAGLAIGNVVGSNIFNVLFILGVSALITPLAVAQQLVRIDVPLMIGISLATWAMAADGNLGRIDCSLLCVGLLGYTVFTIRQSHREGEAIRAEYAAEFGPTEERPSLISRFLLIVVGLATLVVGSRWLVQGAVQLATWWGLSELVVGLTIVAAGTSLPEVATSVLASVRGERDIAVGNVVGSNIFNLFGVLGITGVVSAGGLPVPEAALYFDFPAMNAVALACLPIFFTGHLIARWEGALFLAYYAAYTAYLVLAATHHAALPWFNTAMLLFVLPITGITLAVLTVRARRTL
jgi:cation:H+ antiporter